MFNYLHNNLPNSIAVDLGFFQIHWYGLLVLIGVLLGTSIIIWLAQGQGIARETISDIIFSLIIFGLIGDRIYYVLYNWSFYSQNLLDIFKFWEGGLSIHGAWISGLIVIYYYAKKFKISPWLLLDMIVIGLVAGQIVGRWGNYFNQELFGKPTDLPWGILIEPIKRPVGYTIYTNFHPTFLYESLLNLLLTILLISLFKIKSALNSPQYHGFVALVFFILYSCIRIFTESLRLDYSPFIFGMRWNMFVSILVAVVATFVLVYRVYKIRQNEPKQANN